LHCKRNDSLWLLAAALEMRVTLFGIVQSRTSVRLDAAARNVGIGAFMAQLVFRIGN
jgi:hypothetical protein